jgi:hypothetical protein
MHTGAVPAELNAATQISLLEKSRLAPSIPASAAKPNLSVS